MEADLDPLDRAAVRVLGTAPLVQERSERRLELGLESFLVLGGRREHDVGRLERAGRTLGGERDRALRGLSEPQAVDGGGQPARAAQVPAGEPRRQPGAGLVDPSAASTSTTNDSDSAVNVTTWQRDRTVSGSSCARADINSSTESAGGSSSTLRSVSAAAGDRRSASRIKNTLRPGSGAVR